MQPVDEPFNNGSREQLEVVDLRQYAGVDKAGPRARILRPADMHPLYIPERGVGTARISCSMS